jgi:hypothetical protein
MPYSLDYNEAGFIVLTYQGDAKLKDLNEIIVRGVALAKERNCFRILSDFRAMHLNLSLVDLFSIPANQAVLGQELGVRYYKYRRAVVVPMAEYDKFKFFENVAVNRSHVVRIFTEMNEAISWLFAK